MRAARVPYIGLTALMVTLLAIPTVTAAGAEFDILDGYLAAFDAPGVDGDHCKRRGGHLGYLAGETPVPPSAGPFEPTNSLLAHHFMWHREHTFVTAEISADDADKYGDEFVGYHRVMLADYDAWRSANGYPPTPLWDPSTPIPRAFDYDGGSPLVHDMAQTLRQVTGDGCIQREDEDPRIERPSWTTFDGGSERDPMFGYTALCEFPDMNRLGKSVDWDFFGRTDVDGYHASVHSRVGGDLSPVATAARDPVFWAWHKYLDTAIFAQWEEMCAAPTPAPTSEVAAARGVPGPGAVLTAALVGLVAVWRRRSRELPGGPAP